MLLIEFESKEGKLCCIHTPQRYNMSYEGKTSSPSSSFEQVIVRSLYDKLPAFSTKSKNQLITIKLHSEWVSNFKPEPAVHHWNTSSKKTTRPNIMDSTKVPLANEEPNIWLVNDSENVAAAAAEAALASTARSCGRLDKSDFDYNRDYADE